LLVLVFLSFHFKTRKMAENWKNMMQTQHSDLERLQAMDAALNEDQVAADMDKILNRPSHVAYTSALHKTPPSRTKITKENNRTPPPAAVYESDEDDPSYGDIYGKEVTTSPSKRSPQRQVQNPLASPSIVVNASKAPETADRLCQILWIQIIIELSPNM
jgi:hypothetical protein